MNLTSAFDWSSQDIWASIRATRSNPPRATADDPDRRTTYVTALEQAEQLFRAAAQVGIASRPLLIFYGLSQAGRAVSAAANGERTHDWKLQGHGIVAKNLDQPFGRIAVHCRGNLNASFVALSRLLNSPVFEAGSAILLEEIWETLPELLEWPIRKTTSQRPALNAWAPQASTPHELAAAVVMNIPVWLKTAENTRECFDEFMRAYPTAAGYKMVRQTAELDGPPDLQVGSNGYAQLQMHWEVPGQSGLKSQSERAAFLGERVFKWYRGGQYLLPAVGQNSRPIHPMLAWWAVLFALSMLARYEPSQWARHIDVDTSPHAVPIERLLTHALSAVPDVIMEAIREVQH